MCSTDVLSETHGVLGRSCELQEKNCKQTVKVSLKTMKQTGQKDRKYGGLFSIYLTYNSRQQSFYVIDTRINYNCTIVHCRLGILF